MGYTVMFASELEFFVFRESLDEAAAKGYTDLTPHSHVIEDYHVLQTTRDEYLIRAIRNGVDGAGIPVEFSKGEAGRGQHEINLVYSTRSRWPTGTSSTRTRPRRSRRSTAARSRSWRSTPRTKSDRRATSTRACGTPTAPTSLMWDADAPDHLSTGVPRLARRPDRVRHELAWMYAPTVNSYKRYQPESWAPTALAWSVDNRTCGFRIVGHESSFRLESRIPGADVNPYLAYAATIAAGLHGIERGVDPPPRFNGNAYAATDVHRVPASIVEAIDAFEQSKVAADAFGADVHDHLLNTARQEWLAFNRVGHRLGTPPKLRPVVMERSMPKASAAGSDRGRDARRSSRLGRAPRSGRTRARPRSRGVSRRGRARRWPTRRGRPSRRSRRRCSTASTRSC